MLLIEAEVLPGLKPFARDEIQSAFGAAVRFHSPGDDPEALRFDYDRPLPDLLSLRTVVAIYRLLYYDIPRPKALLGHEHFTRLTGRIDRIRGMHPSGSFETYRFSAAGKDSRVFERLRARIEDHTHLRNDPEDAHLFIRVRPSEVQRTGWDVLLRISPLPLSVRGWRVCDMQGALNATVATAMVALTEPDAADRFFNPMCGSATLLIERVKAGPAALAGGCDTDPEALRCAFENVAAAGLDEQLDVFKMDATNLTDIPDDAFNVICVDLPWGQLSGSHTGNETLYPAALAEFARITEPGGRLVLLTHEITLFESLLSDFSDRWQHQGTHMVYQGGLHPRIYTLLRR